MTCGACATRSGYASRSCSAESNRVCYPLYSATPGWAEESGQFLARMIKSPEVSSHYSHEFPRFDPWSVTAAVRRPSRSPGIGRHA